MARDLPAARRNPCRTAALLGMLMVGVMFANAANAAAGVGDDAACRPALQRDDARCSEASAKAAAPVSPLLAASIWFRPLGERGPREPAAGSVLASVCLAWLILLSIATAMRPRGWRHRPLFGRRRRDAAGVVGESSAASR
jgi:hypothetical protein